MSYLSFEHRLRRLVKRIDELQLWGAREAVTLSHWHLDGRQISAGTAWTDTGAPVRFEHAAITAPSHWTLAEARLELDLGGEGLVEIRGANGEVRKLGLDPYHKSFLLPGGTISVVANCVARLPLGVPNRDAKLGRTQLVWREPTLDAFVISLRQVVELARAIGGTGVDAIPLEKFHPHRRDPQLLNPHPGTDAIILAAETAIRMVRLPTDTVAYLSRYATSDEALSIWRLPSGIEQIPRPLGTSERESVHAAHAHLRSSLTSLMDRYPRHGAIAATGHAHIDLTWLWPLAETRRKARRTFHTVVHLMDRYPDFRFNQSTAQLYEYIRQDDPELFKTIAARVEAGQWEIIGGMWVEPDTNMPSAESLIRQLLYGIRYFDALFGKKHRSSVNWLPDCFGFSPAMPQILRGAGLTSLFTHKTNWSEKNRIPDDTFWWEGIDGSRVLVHTYDNPAGGYNGRLGARAMVETWRNYRNIDKVPESLLAFGFGDGGGGPTEEMLEIAAALEHFPALPRLRQVNVSEWFSQIVASHENDPSFPRWNGELYLEYHRGTLTTQARTKYLHRRAERALITAEVVAGLDHLLGGERPVSLEESWRLLLKNEFHDILPGSSIGEVYKEAEPELASVVASGKAAQEESLSRLATRLGQGTGEGHLVVNPDALARPMRLVSEKHEKGWQEVDGGSVLATDKSIGGLSICLMPNVGMEAAGELRVTATSLENQFVRAQFNADGTLSSLWDKRSGRECLDGRGNQIRAHADRPRNFDAWDIEEDDAQFSTEVVSETAAEVVEHGPHRAAIRVVRRFGSSTIVQTIRLWSNSPRLEFKTDLDWHDRRVLLKAVFPLSVRSDHALFECAGGVISRPTHRNTDWEKVKYEVSAHRFVDVSESGFGVALLNDGRYGHHALGNEVGISLLRSPVYPDPMADEGQHSFTYALLPHSGDWIRDGVLSEAEDLNQPLLHSAASADAAREWGVLRLDGQTVALCGLKLAEDGQGLILRVYEPAGGRGKVVPTLPEGWRIASEVNLLEEEPRQPEFHFGPHMIRSWRLSKS